MAAGSRTRVAVDRWRRDNIGRHMNNAIRRFELRVLELLAEAGHTELGLTHINLTRNLDLAGTRLTELARLAGMTKQSMGELVSQAEAIGIITRRRDPKDGRARLIVFTARGRRWLDAFRSALETAEAEMQKQIGKARLEAVKQALAAYASAADDSLR
jgi:DNA-binding MarR family transcriptional regulator